MGDFTSGPPFLPNPPGGSYVNESYLAQASKALVPTSAPFFFKDLFLFQHDPGPGHAFYEGDLGGGAEVDLSGQYVYALKWTYHQGGPLTEVQEGELTVWRVSRADGSQSAAYVVNRDPDNVMGVLLIARPPSECPEARAARLRVSVSALY